MSLWLVDSVGWIAYFKGDALARGYREHILRQSDIICPTIIIYEVSKKIETQISRQAAAMAVAQMTKNETIPLDQSIAVCAARVSIEHKLAMADAIVYATALLNQAALLTSDAHFRNLPYVELIPRIS
jgi:predicted nucleic acid-binding protein